MKKMIFVTIAILLFSLLISVVLVMIIFWYDFGVGRGLQYQREYTRFAKQNFWDGNLSEAVQWMYRAAKWGAQTEITWFLVKDDIDLFSELVTGENYIEADQLCSKVGGLFEHGPGPDIWQNFTSDCQEVGGIVFNKMVQHCRELGILQNEEPMSKGFYDQLSDCKKIWRAKNDG